MLHQSQDILLRALGALGRRVYVCEGFNCKNPVVVDCSTYSDRRTLCLECESYSLKIGKLVFDELARGLPKESESDEDYTRKMRDMAFGINEEAINLIKDDLSIHVLILKHLKNVVKNKIEVSGE